MKSKRNCVASQEPPVASAVCKVEIDYVCRGVVLNLVIVFFQARRFSQRTDSLEGNRKFHPGFVHGHVVSIGRTNVFSRNVFSSSPVSVINRVIDLYLYFIKFILPYLIACWINIVRFNFILTFSCFSLQTSCGYKV